MRGYRWRMSLTPNDIQRPHWNTRDPKSRDNRCVLLAADVGGTKTLLGLFEEAPESPPSIEGGELVILAYEALAPMIREFLKAEGVQPSAVAAASFGVAGAVTDNV